MGWTWFRNPTSDVQIRKIWLKQLVQITSSVESLLSSGHNKVSGKVMGGNHHDAHGSSGSDCINDVKGDGMTVGKMMPLKGRSSCWFQLLSVTWMLISASLMCILEISAAEH